MNKYNIDNASCSRKLNLRGVIIATAAIALGVSMSSAAFAKPIELIYNIFIPPQARVVRDGLEPWARQVEAASKGTLKLTIPTSSIAPTPKLWDAVEDGLADIALVVNASRANTVTLPTILNIPLMDGNAEQVSRALWETQVKYFSKAKEYGDLIPLAGFATNGPQIMATKRHVKTIEDLAGLKIRVEGAMIVKLFEALGASPLGATGLDTFQLLTGGIADASLSPFGSALVQGQVGVTNEITTFPGGFSRSGFTLVMNRAKFESLPTDAQNALISTSGVELSAHLGSVVDADEAAGRAAFIADHARITEAPEALVDTIRGRSQFIVNDWLAIAEKRGLSGLEILDYYRSRIAAAK